MNTSLLSTIAALGAEYARLVDEVCDRFETALQRGDAPRIEDYLREVPEAARPVLLCELIRLDGYYRREDYRRRFPELDPATLAACLADAPAPEADARDRYELVRFHAQGGMGRVSVYYDRELRRHVALKELHPERAPRSDVLCRFLQEAQITGRLEHPGVVPIYELMKPAPGRAPFYTMRFVNGRTLTEATTAYHTKRQRGEVVALDLLALLNAFVSVCQTVAYAHSQGVVHRDLKGNNVVLGDFGEVIVLDWGLAKVVESPAEAHEFEERARDDAPIDRTLPGAVKGTPGYLAPEQAAGRTDLIGPRTDVYGLGAILYEILTGKAPFTGSSVREVLAHVEHAPPSRPTALVPDVPVALEAACLRALAKEPAARHASAGELAAEVQQWLAESADRSRARQERERFFNLSLDMLCTVGPDEHFHQLNPAWEQTLGWTREELVGRPFIEFVHPDDRTATLVEARQILAGAGRRTGPPLENRYLCKDGSYRWVSWTASLIVGEQLIYAVGRDISERKNAEAALRRSQERFELAVRGSGDGLWDWDRETGESYYSPRWKSMIGYEDHEISHDIAEWESRLHPDDRERALAALNSCLTGAAPAYEVEYRFRHKDGSYRWILDRGVAVRNAVGVARMAGSHTDITDRKRMEQELRESEQRHQAALAELTAELARLRERLNEGERSAPVG